MKTIDQLGTIAAEVAMKAAVAYVKANNLKIVNYDTAISCLKSHCKFRLPVALNEAKAAFDCGMAQVAETTFKLTMAQAGIEAAKEFACR